MSGDREADLVELVDEAGNPSGATSVAAAHADPPTLHRAFSVLLTDGRGRVLLQRRAAIKTRFAGRWANTCCGHPGPGRDLISAARQRLEEEMGLRNVSLREVGTFVYRARDPQTGRTEYEYDHVLVGTTRDLPSPDPAEVDEWVWESAEHVLSDLDRSPDSYVPWLRQVLQLAAQQH